MNRTFLTYKLRKAIFRASLLSEHLSLTASERCIVYSCSKVVTVVNLMCLTFPPPYFVFVTYDSIIFEENILALIELIKISNFLFQHLFKSELILKVYWDMSVFDIFHLDLFRPLQINKVKTGRVEHCIDTKSSCLGFTF